MLQYPCLRARVCVCARARVRVCAHVRTCVCTSREGEFSLQKSGSLHAGKKMIGRKKLQLVYISCSTLKKHIGVWVDVQARKTRAKHNLFMHSTNK